MADVQTDDRAKLKRVDEIFDELRKQGKTNQEIFGEAYYPLKQLARRMLSGKPIGDSMHASRLVSDLYEKLSGKFASDFDWKSGVNFFSYMARAMQNLLIDYLRNKRRRSAESLDQLTKEPTGQPSSPGNANWEQERADRELIQKESAKNDSLALMKYLTWLKNEEYIKSIKNHELNEDSELDENEGLIGVDERKLKIAIALVWLAEESETDEKRREIARRQAEIMRYRAILGWTEDDVAKFLGKSSETITKDYKKAKAKLLTFIEAAEGEAPAP